MIHYDDAGEFERVSIDIAAYAKFLAEGTNRRGTSLRKSLDYWLKRTLLPKIRAYTPVSTPRVKKDGTVEPENPKHARDSWKAVIVPDGYGGEIIQIESDKIYSQFLEYGSKPGKKPWPNPTNVRTEISNDPNYDGFHQTTELRVWAGLKNPGTDSMGDSLSRGGPIARAMYESGRNTKDSDSYNYGTDTGAYISFSPLINSVINDVFRRISKDYKPPVGSRWANMNFG